MANLVKFDPFTELETLQKQIFNNDWLSPTLANKMVLPTTDVYMDSNNQLIVEAHLPNFDQKDVNIDINNDSLEIQAEKHEAEKDKQKKYVVRESSSSFYRSVRLPSTADTSKIKAEMDDGVLKVRIPLKKLPAPKKISISSTGKKR